MSCYMCTVLVYSYCTACTELFSCTDVTSDRALTSFVKGSYRNHFSPPRACALRNGRGARSHSRACSSAIATLTMSLTVACASSVRMPLSRSHLRISKAASVSVPPDSSSGGSDYILEQPVGPPGPWPGSSHAHRRWASDVPWSIPYRKRFGHRPACRSARALKSHLFHRCRLEETAGGTLLLTERS